MFNNIFQIMIPGKAKVPVATLILSVSVLGLTYAAEQNKQLLSSTNLAVNYLAPSTQNELSSHPDILSKLRNIKKEEKISQSSHQIVQNSSDKLTQDVTNLSTNIRELDSKLNTNKLPDQDGIYLYGQSSKANELGNGYIVLQKQKGKISGALYVPNSEFSCFQGTLAKSGELAMTVNSSPGEVGVMKVSTTSNITQSSDQESTSYAHSLNLQNYYQLNIVSQQDKNILQVCQQELGGFQ